MKYDYRGNPCQVKTPQGFCILDLYHEASQYYNVARWSLDQNMRRKTDIIQFMEGNKT